MTASNRRLLNGVSGLAMAGALAVAPQAALAEQWTGAVSGDWYDAANWVGGVPAGAFDVLVNRTAPHPLVLDRGTVDLGGKAIAVGTTADGAMTITGGADLVSGQSTITAEPQSTGIVTVTGDGSTWTTDHLVVGFQGAATLRVENGGVVKSGIVTVARNGGSGVVTVDGEGSRWEIGDTDTWFGNVGAAEVTVSNGGVVTNANRVHLGNMAGSSGSVTVDGAGSRWEIGENLVIGLNGAGALAVTGGGYVEADIVTLGSRTPGQATSLILDGKGSELHAEGGIQIGFADEPVMRITGGARLTTGRVEDDPFIGRSYVGYLQPRGQSASVLISGEGSVWEDANYIIMGNFSSDTTIRVEAGGALKGEAMDVGRGRGIDPTNPDNPFYVESRLLVSGAGTTVDFDWLSVGNAGAEATADISGGAVVTTGRTLLGGGSTSMNGINALSDVDLVLSGAGTRWTTTETGEHSFAVDQGESRIRVTDRARLDVAGDMELGGYYYTTVSQSTLQMTIDGAGTAHAGGNGLLGRAVGSVATATVDGAGSAWTVDGQLVVGAGGDGTLLAANSGRIAAAGIEIARDAGSGGTLVVGGETAAAAAGVVETPTIVFGAGTGELVFNHTGTFTLSAALGGTGTVRQRAGVTRLTGDSAGFAGTTVVDGGALSVLERLGGRVELGSGILYGTGAIGGDLAVTGGVLSPGADAAGDIGRLVVGGNFSIAGSAFYTTNIAGNGGSDLLAVTGSAALNGGTVHVSALDPEASYAAGQTYTILTAGAGVTGQFAGLQTASAFIDPKLSYEAGAVRLTINESDLRFTDVAKTWNQWQAAFGLEALERDGDALAVYNQLLMQAAPQARAAFDLASGEAHAAAQHLTRNTAGLFLGALQGRAGAGLSAAQPSLAAAPMAYSPEPRPQSLPSGLLAADAPAVPVEPYAAPAAHAGWIAPLFGGGSIDGDGNAAGMDWRGIGVAGGYEGRGDTGGGRYVAGLAFGYLNGDADIDARGSDVEAHGVHVGLYGGWTNDAWMLSGAVAYSASKLSTERAVVFGGIDRLASADYWSHAVAASGEVARNFDLGGVTLSPFAGLEAGWTGHRAASEQGAGALNLSLDATDYRWFDTALGLGVSHGFATADGGAVRLHARAAWVHALGDVTPEQDLAFAGSPQAFTVRGPGVDRDRARVSIGADFSTAGGLEIGAVYSGEFSSGVQSHGGKISLGMTF